MNYFATALLLNTSLLISVSFAVLCIYLLTVYKHWTRAGIPQEQGHIPFGSIKSPYRKEHNNFIFRRWHNKHKQQGHRHYGFYILHKPVYAPVDLEIVKSILVKDFDCFTDRGLYLNDETDPIGTNLFTVTNDKWRKLRTQLTPAFTPAKMKMLFETLVNCSDEMLNYVETNRINCSAIDAKEVAGCFTTDVIGSFTCGLQCSSFKDEEAPFRKFGRKSVKVGMARAIITYIFPKLCKNLGVNLYSPDVSNFFVSVIKDAVAYRKKEIIRRNDYLQLLIDVMNAEGEDFTIEKVAAEVFVFFATGYGLTATNMSFCLYELALNKKIQDKAREEIRSVFAKHGNKLTYEGVHEMKYLSQVMDGM